MKVFVKIFAFWWFVTVFSLPLASAEGNFAWISSDEKYGKFFAPAKVQVIEQAGDIPTRISAITKTVYNYGGAVETIENYDIEDLVTPKELAYSLAKVEINPQERTIEYVEEIFYDKNDKILWQKQYYPRTVKEINSQAFDEDFYTAIVDAVFYYGETARRKATDRWISLWDETYPDGSKSTAIADTTTMRMPDKTHLVYWEWVEETNIKGVVSEIKFRKRIVNLKEGSDLIVYEKRWTATRNWQIIRKEAEREFIPIEKNSVRQKGLRRLRAFSTGYSYWLTRYQLGKR